MSRQAQEIAAWISEQIEDTEAKLKKLKSDLKRVKSFQFSTQQQEIAEWIENEIKDTEPQLKKLRSDLKRVKSFGNKS